MKSSLKLLILSLIFSFNIEIAQAVIIPETKPEQKQEVALSKQSTEDNNLFDYTAISAQITAYETEIKNNTFTAQSLNEASNYLSTQDLELDSIIKNIEKNAKYTDEALLALGEKPTDDAEPEDAAISEKRERYSSEQTYYKNKQTEAKLLKAEIARVLALISEARSNILIGSLVAEQNVLVKPDTFFRALSDAAVLFWEITKSPIVWYQSLNDEQKNELHHKWWYVLLILSAVLSLGLYLKHYIIQHWGYRKTTDIPRYGQKITVAIITAIAYGVIPSLLIGGCLLWQISNPTLTHSKFGIVLANVLYYSLYITLTRALTRVVLAPWNGRWRLFNITDERAERVFGATTLSIILIGTISCIKKIATYFDPSETLDLFLEVSADAIKAFVIILLASKILGETKTKPSETEETTSNIDSENKDEAKEDTEQMSLSTKIIIFTSLFACITFGISIFGYPGLATFIFNRFIASIILVGLFVIIRKFISDLLRRCIVFWISTFKLRKKLLSKADLVMSLFITPVLVMFLIFSLLTAWGIPGAFMLHGIKKLIFGFKVGGIEISILAILTGLVIFLISFTLVKVLKKRLTNTLMNRINMDESIKHSLISGFGFFGTIISAILAIVAMGVDLSNLAVIAGALSVGIGFGLQDVIKNLVSGFIILFERPFKIGDWVIIAGQEGKIKQISIRSTELETFNRTSVIIPNATLISSSLINLTHENNWQRQSIAVGVTYDSDPEQVTRVLLDCTKSNKKIVKNPSPYVVFKDFGSSSLDFELRFYVSDIWSGWGVGSEMRYEIFKRFKEEGIEIAFPQIVVHQAKD